MARKEARFWRLKPALSKNGFLFAEFKDDDDSSPMLYTVILYDNGDFFSQKVGSDVLSANATSLKTPLAEYCSLVKSCLNGFETSENFMIEISKTSDNGSGRELKLKQILSNELKYQIANIKLTKLDSSECTKAQLDLFSWFLESNAKLREQLSEVELTKISLEEQKTTILEKLDEAANVKAKFENEIFNKFALLLNSKKEKIRELEEKLGDLMKSQEITGSPVKELVEPCPEPAPGPSTKNKPSKKAAKPAPKKRQKSKAKGVLYENDDSETDQEKDPFANVVSEEKKTDAAKDLVKGDGDIIDAKELESPSQSPNLTSVVAPDSASKRSREEEDKNSSDEDFYIPKKARRRNSPLKPNSDQVSKVRKSARFSSGRSSSDSYDFEKVMRKL